MALPAITGDINFDGNVIYTSSTVSFVGNEGVSSGTGTLADFGTCNGCISATNITYSPFAGPINNFLSGTNGAISFALDLLSVFNVQFVSANDLDFDGNVVLHLTGFAGYPRRDLLLQPGSERHRGLVQRDRRADRWNLPASPSWASACWGWVTSSTSRRVPLASIPAQRHNKRGNTPTSGN